LVVGKGCRDKKARSKKRAKRAKRYLSGGRGGTLQQNGEKEKKKAPQIKIAKKRMPVNKTLDDETKEHRKPFFHLGGGPRAGSGRKLQGGDVGAERKKSSKKKKKHTKESETKVTSPSSVCTQNLVNKGEMVSQSRSLCVRRNPSLVGTRTKRGK